VHGRRAGLLAMGSWIVVGAASLASDRTRGGGVMVGEAVEGGGGGLVGGEVEDQPLLVWVGQLQALLHQP
jgi:hypothetical protein